MGQPCEIQLHVCDCVFVCKLAVCMPVYTCARQTHSRVPVRIGDRCDSLHHRHVQGSHPCLCNLLHGDLHVWYPSVVRMACGGEGEAHFCVCKIHTSMRVEGIRQKQLDLPDKRPTAVSKPATQHPFVVSWWRGERRAQTCCCIQTSVR